VIQYYVSYTIAVRALEKDVDSFQTKEIGMIFSKISRRQRIMLYTQLAQVLEAGIAPIQGLKLVAEQTSRKIKRVVGEMALHVQDGGSLSSAFKQHPNVFPKLEAQLIEASERIGNTHIILSQLANYHEKMLKYKRQFVSAMIYPAFLLITALFLIPLFQSVFLGGTEVLLMRTGGYLLYSAGGGVVVVLIYRALKYFSLSRLVMQWWALRIPWIGKLLRRLARLRFVMNFGCLYAAGVSVPKAYAYASKVCGNEVVSRRILKGLPILKEGGKITEALSRTRQFTPIELGMVDVGEQTGKIDETLQKMAAYEEIETDAAMDRVSKRIPFLVYLGVMGYIVYFIVSFYMNYFAQINEAMNF